MARAYLKFKKTGTFTYHGGVAVDVSENAKLDEIWAAAHDLMFKEYIVREREYDNEEWSFELVEVEEKDEAEDAKD